MAEKESLTHSACIITQHEIRIVGADYVDAPGPQGPIPTLRLSRAAVQWAHWHGLDELIIVAAKPHVWRCVRDLKYAAQEVNFKIDIRPSRLIDKVPRDHWFRGDSRQWYTQNQIAWHMRDSILRVMPMFFYTRIAS